MKLIKRVSFLIVLAAMVLFIPLDSHAAFFMTGNELVEKMREYENRLAGNSNFSFFDVGSYMGYVQGIYDSTSGLVFDPFAEVTVAQVCAVVAKYLKENPEKWNQPAHLLVIEALKKAFPKK